MNPAQIDQLRATLGQRLTGDSSFDGSPNAYSLLTPDQQITLTNQMKAYIREHPGEFNVAQQAIGATPDIQLTEQNGYGSDVATFTDEFTNQLIRAGDSVASIGNGVLTTVKAASWVIPTVSFLAAAVFLYGFFLKQTKQ